MNRYCEFIFADKKNNYMVIASYKDGEVCYKCFISEKEARQFLTMFEDDSINTFAEPIKTSNVGLTVVEELL